VVPWHAGGPMACRWSHGMPVVPWHAGGPMARLSSHGMGGPVAYGRAHEKEKARF